VEVIKVGPHMPNKNAHMERWIQSLQVECLRHFVIFGEKHLQYLVSEYLAFYNVDRPHQALDNQPLPGPTNAVAPENWQPEDVFFEERLGGVLHHCHWKQVA
jgi:putative transposase